MKDLIKLGFLLLFLFGLFLLTLHLPDINKADTKVEENNEEVITRADIVEPLALDKRHFCTCTMYYSYGGDRVDTLMCHLDEEKGKKVVRVRDSMGGVIKKGVRFRYVVSCDGGN